MLLVIRCKEILIVDIIGEIINDNGYKYYLRNNCKDDIDLLFVWANDFSVRQNSFNSKQISYEEHCK